MTSLRRPILSLVSDRRRLTPGARTTREAVTALEHFLDAAIGAGITQIHIRERDLEARDLAGLVRRTMDRARSAPTSIIVNDRADVAIVAGADGVHLRGDGPPTATARALVGTTIVVGRSVHREDEAARERGLADYLLFGTVHPSASKAAGHEVAGVDGLRRAVRAAAGTPVVAIGGVTLDNVAACSAAGAAGVAGIGLFLPASGGGNLESALARVVRKLADAFGGHGTSGHPQSVV